jgi:hypothetical protein
MPQIKDNDIVAVKEGSPSLTGTATHKGIEALNAIKASIGPIFDNYFNEGVEAEYFDVAAPTGGWQNGMLKIGLIFEPAPTVAAPAPARPVV